ncbi:MAG: hypothetical protein ACI9Y1_003630 [Lentisphaeria bacterium]|jgi:hypothetical protein
MQSYNPAKTPDSDRWLASDEGSRLNLVRSFHEAEGTDFEDEGAFNLHSCIHVLVENQLALAVDLVPETLAKLQRQGLNRHEAIHAVGAVVCTDLFGLLKGNQTKFNPALYRRKLENLPPSDGKKANAKVVVYCITAG